MEAWLVAGVAVVALVVVAVAAIRARRLVGPFERERQHVMLAVVVEDPVPAVRGGEARLEQGLVDLLPNAVKFSLDGGDVTIAVPVAGPDVVVSVADHGIGVLRAAQARVFERFYKVDRARVRGETGGTGPGLAIARAGSTFSFSVPSDAPPA